MLNSKDNLLAQLNKLALSPDEAKVYLELLREPSTHLRLSHDTGINRTKVYRLIEQLEKRSLVTRRSDDRGVFLVAADPSTLEVTIVTQEEALKQQRSVLQQLVPALSLLQKQDMSNFVLRTYEGQAGLKQMCWHELKTQGELVALGNGTIEQTVTDDRWAAKHRERQVAAGYKTRDLINFGYTTNDLPELAAEKLMASKLYVYRILSPEVLCFDNQTVVYNNTVAIYHWKRDQKVGIEIISSTYAQMMRQIFEHYWNIAT